jgi:hypothetical protein
MSDNEHYTKAKSRLHNGTNNEVARAHVEATLALTHEQRTANLLTAFGLLGNHEEGETLLGERMDGLELAKEIKERLAFK